MELPDGEPDCGPWRTVAVADLYPALGRPRVLAVDGRSGSGKSTLVARLVATVPGAAVVHTDDVAWYHDFFDWADLLADGVLAPWRAGQDVAYRPPAWEPAAGQARSRCRRPRRCSSSKGSGPDGGRSARPSTP